MKLAISTGGGDCPGLNAAIRGIVKNAIGHYGMEVVGIPDGFNGLLEDPVRLLPLSIEDVSPSR